MERRTFLGFVLAAPTLVAAAQIGEAALAPPAAALPSPPRSPRSSTSTTC